MSVAKITGRHVLIHPLDRWSLAAMRELEQLNLPVVQTELMPRGKLYVVDPGEIEPDLSQAVSFE